MTERFKRITGRNPPRKVTPRDHSSEGVKGSFSGLQKGLQHTFVHSKGKSVLDSRYRELQTLQEINQIILTSPDLKATLEKILEKASAIGSFDLGTIRLLDHRTAIIESVVSRGYQDPKNIELHRKKIDDAASGSSFRDIMSRGAPYVEESVQRRKGLRTFKREGVQAAVMVPVRTDEVILGVLQLGCRTPRKFAPAEVHLLQAIGNQVGIAVQKARLLEESQQLAREQAALNAIAMATSRALDLKELFEIALNKTVEVTGRESVTIRLKDTLTGKVELVADRGFTEEEIKELHNQTPHPMSEQVFASGNPLIINDTGVPRSPGLLKRTRSVAWIPIKAGTKVVGVLGISDDQSKPFFPSEVELLQAIGSVIGVAIENARLFSETKRNLERVRALREIDQAITSTLDLDAVLNVLLQKIDLVLPYAATTVRLFNKQSGLLEPVACRNLDEREWKAEQWRAGRGIPNVVFETRAPVRINNVRTDPRNKDLNFFTKHGLVSYLGVPLIIKDEVLGVISFYTKEEHEFSNEEVEFLTTLAGQAAIAIHNSQVYQEMVSLAAQLSRSNKVKDEFLSVMSHEFRTPLNVVMGYTGMMRDGLLGEINPEQEKALEKVISRARDQLTMISGILQATQIEAEGIKMEKREVSLKDFLDDLKSSYSIPLGKELALVWDYPANLPAIHTDGEKLKHVLQNLINNAVKFTERGRVTVSARSFNGSGESRRQEAEGDGRKGAVEFKVADTGIGIAKEFFPLIFDRFRQVDSSETRRYGGVGIGLYVAKKFTELIGGEIEVESEPGKGSTFTVTIPWEN